MTRICKAEMKSTTRKFLSHLLCVLSSQYQITIGCDGLRNTYTDLISCILLASISFYYLAAQVTISNASKDMKQIAQNFEPNKVAFLKKI